jgi:chromosome segregation ATPase
LKQQIKTVENDVKGHILNLQKQKSLMIGVEKERDRNAEEVQAVGDKVDQLSEDMLVKQTQITQLKEKLVEVQVKLAQVQLLFETARTERSAFQRDLQTCTEERDNLKERMRVSLFVVYIYSMPNS